MINNIDDKYLESTYQKHRKCKIIRGDKSECLENAERMTLGYTKAKIIVDNSDIKNDHVVLNVFSGAGGIVRLISLFNPKMLIALDMLNPGYKCSKNNWYYDTDNAFNSWIDDIYQFDSTIKITHPLFIQHDATEYNPAFKDAIDRIILDPPLGILTNDVFNISKVFAEEILIQSLNNAISYLKSDGFIICIMPFSWSNRVKQTFHYCYDILRLNGNKQDLIILKIMKQGGSILNPLYPDLFSRYAQHHTGKQNIGNELVELLKHNEKRENDIAIDIGAGNGEITNYLADIFYRVDAIERNIELTNAIREKNRNNINVVLCDILNYSSNEKYNLVLMSYLLDSYSDTTKTIEIMTNVNKLVANDGIVLGITYLHDCAWNKFSEIVCNDLNKHRIGGMKNVERRLSEACYKCHILKTVDSYIWGNTIEELFFNLSFFYKSKISTYLDNKEKYIKLLDKYASTLNDLFIINVKEAIFSIRKN